MLKALLRVFYLSTFSATPYPYRSACLQKSCLRHVVSPSSLYPELVSFGSSRHSVDIQLRRAPSVSLEFHVCFFRGLVFSCLRILFFAPNFPFTVAFDWRSQILSSSPRLSGPSGQQQSPGPLFNDLHLPGPPQCDRSEQNPHLSLDPFKQEAIFMVDLVFSFGSLVCSASRNMIAFFFTLLQISFIRQNLSFSAKWI